MIVKDLFSITRGGVFGLCACAQRETGPRSGGGGEGGKSEHLAFFFAQLFITALAYKPAQKI